jgi:hypothetical protein
MRHGFTTYREVLEALKNLSEEDLDKTATVYVRGVDEYYPIQTFGVTPDTDVLDKDHPYFLV